MKCPHCGKTIGPVHLKTEEPPAAQQQNYDEMNPPPIEEELAPSPKSYRGSTQTNKYITMDVYVHAESDKALLIDDQLPGSTATFEKVFFPKSQMLDAGGNELGGSLRLGWVQTYQTVQLAEWLVKKKGIID